MTITFFGRNISASSTAGKLILVGAVCFAMLLVGYSAYLGIRAIAAELHVHPVLVFVVLFVLTVELTFDGRKVALLPGQHTRELLGWACFLVSVYHYVSLDQKLEVAVVCTSALVTLVGRFAKLVAAHREAQWRIKRAIQTEMVDLKYGKRSDE